MMMTDRGSAARNKMLFAVVRYRIEDGGVYWTSDRENRGGNPALAIRDDGTNPVSSFHQLDRA
jgi:hypothetical protein